MRPGSRAGANRQRRDRRDSRLGASSRLGVSSRCGDSRDLPHNNRRGHRRASSHHPRSPAGTSSSRGDNPHPASSRVNPRPVNLGTARPVLGTAGPVAGPAGRRLAGARRSRSVPRLRGSAETGRHPAAPARRGRRSSTAHPSCPQERGGRLRHRGAASSSGERSGLAGRRTDHFRLRRPAGHGQRGTHGYIRAGLRPLHHHLLLGAGSVVQRRSWSCKACSPFPRPGLR